jgi:tRNA (mo5U34)-methyltransferase
MPTWTSWAVDRARHVVTRRRAQHASLPEGERGDPAVRAQIDGLGTWFHNIDIAGTPTKVRSFAGEPVSYPRQLWNRTIKPVFPEVRGKSVLDIGCNAGFFSIESKRMGASRVVGVDVSQGTPDDFIAQAEYAADKLGLDIEYRRQDFMTLNEQFDVVIFLGVMYHLDDPVRGLRHAGALANECIVVETAAVAERQPILRYKAPSAVPDPTSFWFPSPSLVDRLLTEGGFTRLERPRLRTRERYVVCAHR